MLKEAVSRIHERLRHDLGGPSTPVDPAVYPGELESMKKRLWGPLARETQNRRLIEPRWDEYGLKRRLALEPSVRRYTRSLIDTFWAGYPEAERRGMEKDVMEIYADPAEAFQMMPFSLPFVIHQSVHLITNDEEFIPRLVSQLIGVPSLESFGKKKIPAAWADPVAREVFPWWGDLLERDEGFGGIVKHLRGNRILNWLGSRVLALHREGRPLAGRFGDLYLFFRSHLQPTRAYLRWIDAAATALATLRAPGDARPLETREIAEAWESVPGGVEALKPGAIELTLKGGFVTERFFAARQDYGAATPP